MTDKPKFPPCEVCGKPATSAARDVYRKENWETGWYDSEPSKVIHYGCDAHPPESQTIEISSYQPMPTEVPHDRP